MRTRIKIINYSNGKKEYIPQNSSFIFFWNNWYNEIGDDAISFDTEEQARMFIYNYFKTLFTWTSYIEIR